MKKKMTKLMSLVLAMVMVLSLGVMNVSAKTYDTTGLDTEKTTGTLTLSKSDASDDKTDSKYSYYKVLDATYVEGSDVYEYSWTTAFENFANKAQTAYGLTLDEIDALKNGPADYKIGGTDTADKLGTALEKFVTDSKITGTEITLGTSTELNLGYYLVLETKTTEGTFAAKPMLIAVPSKNWDVENSKYEYNVTVTMKDQPYETVTKTILESTEEKQQSWKEQVGKPHTYEVWVPVPYANPAWEAVYFKVDDKMDKGLTYQEIVSVESYNKDKSKIKDLILNTDYAFSKTEYSTTDGTTLTFDFSDHSKEETSGANYWNSVKGAAYIKLVYKAVINENAEFGPSGNVNEVVPKFGPDPNPEIIGKEPGPKTKVYSGGLKITKKSGANLLEGAGFTVYTNEDCTEEAKLVTYTVDNQGNITATPNEDLSATATTGKDGIVKFNGLGEGTYWIKETTTPGGYVGLGKEKIKVVVEVKLPDVIETGNEKATFTYKVTLPGKEEQTYTNDTGIVEFEVQNEKGFTLPTTGGMGTYIFTIGGAVLILAAVVLLIRSKKKAR